jgi:hypothetical protein
MTKAKSAAQKASGIGTLDIKGGKPVPKAGATGTSSSSSSASAGKPKATTTATITNWMGKSKPKQAPPTKPAAATPEGLTVVKAGAGGGADLRAALIKASVSAPKAAAATADRRTLLVHCVNDAGALSADVEDRLGLLWAQSARDAWTQHAAGGDDDEQEAPLGEIQMAKLTKKTKKNEDDDDDDDGVAGKLWLVNAVTHESGQAAKGLQSSSPPGAFSAAAFESAMGMVAAIAKVRKAVVVLALVTRPGGRGPAERAEALRIVARQLLAKKVHVVVYEIAADISDDDDGDDDDDDDHEQQTVAKKSTKPAAVVRGEEEQGSGSDTEDMDDDALEDLLRGKGKGKPLPAVAGAGAKPQQQTHNATKPPAKPPVVVKKGAAAPMTSKPMKKEEEDGSGSDTEEMDAMDVVVAAAEKPKAKKTAVVPTREPTDSDSGTEEMDMADLKPQATLGPKAGAVPNKPKPDATKATVAGDATAAAAAAEEEGSGSDTEEMDVEQEKANAAKAKEEIIVDTTTKRKRGEAAQKQVTRKKRAKREQESEEERRKREERRVGRLLRGVGVVFGDGVDGDAKRELAQQIEAMGGTVSQVCPAPTAHAHAPHTHTAHAGLLTEREDTGVGAVRRTNVDTPGARRAHRRGPLFPRFVVCRSFRSLLFASFFFALCD